jgi:hypothetical protein
MPEINLTKDDWVKYGYQLGLLDGAGGDKFGIVTKTADYTVVAPTPSGGDKSGTIFNNRGAGGAVNFTLPAPSAALKGVNYIFYGVAGQNITVTGGAGNVVTFNNAAAASVAASTSSQKIGARIDAICDGTSWFLIGVTVGVTYTVA